MIKFNLFQCIFRFSSTAILQTAPDGILDIE